MSKEQEAQQAQTIAEFKVFYEKWLFDCAQLHEEPDYEIRALGTVLEIVDSQAQKIAEQEKRIAELEKAAEYYVRKIESWGI